MSTKFGLLFALFFVNNFKSARKVMWKGDAMSQDIDAILKYWLQIAEQMRVELLEIDGKRDRLQISLDDIIFYYLWGKGRPDGKPAQENQSRLQFHKNEMRALIDVGKNKILDENEVKRLIQEILCYFPRSLAYLKIGDFRACAFDVHHCLVVAKFASQYSALAFKSRFMQMLPIMHMLYYLSLAAMSLASGHARRAVGYLNRGIYRIEFDQTQLTDDQLYVGYEEILRMKYFKKMIIRVKKQRKNRHRRYQLEDENISEMTIQPQDHICHLLSQKWRYD